MHRTVTIALASIVIGALVFAIKYAAYYVTGSVALYSDALESLINIAAALAALAALRLSARPADRSHPYGHHKVEYFSAVLEGVLIVGAAMIIMREAYLRFETPVEIAAPVQGVIINAVATAINAAWCLLLIREGRRHASPALIADGRHIMADVVTSVGVVAGILMAMWTGWLILDPIMAGVVALNILWSGWVLVKDSVSGLMDAAVPQATQERIRELISHNADGAIEAHDLKTRQAGPATFIEFHLVVPGEMAVERAHDICDRIEQALRHEFEKAEITIHVEPEHKAKHNGVVVV